MNGGTLIPATVRAQYEALFVSPSGLPGCALLIDRLHVALLRSHRLNRQVAVLAFTHIEHEADLGAVADRLRKKLRPDDTIAQPIDATLVVVCNDIADEEALDTIRNRLLDAIGIDCLEHDVLSMAGAGAQELVEHVLSRAHVAG